MLTTLTGVRQGRQCILPLLRDCSFHWHKLGMMSHYMRISQLRKDYILFVKHLADILLDNTVKKNKDLLSGSNTHDLITFLDTKPSTRFFCITELQVESSVAVTSSFLCLKGCDCPVISKKLNISG